MHKHKHDGQNGSVVVEFALVLPVLLMIVFGIIECSIALYDKTVITNASREAARAGIVLRSPKLSTSDIKKVATDYCGSNLISFGADPSLQVNVTTVGGAAFGTPLTVTVAYDYQGLALGSPLSALSSPITLSATTIMNNE
jgi:Flp pilus assembly protein TadG